MDCPVKPNFYRSKTMEQTFTITVTKTVRVRIDDKNLTAAAVANFSSAICKINGPDDLMKHAAQMVAQYEDHFVEGIGPAASFWQGETIGYKIEDEQIECELDTV
jgi:hypothetical protein